ncbi:GNAT family N-acetyltransferase [Halovulum dunhuangense]|uniref:GNAT family N-acetyltransferase n=1 Tax=Halovulum dunhuangense TaxID=1505036 RepID=A0A849L5F5_9RHOB|nr:GNAT family N-acetyltransferase [Halovulum dunhuangense]NNU81412.1 GNAT family N-acetyltransferase [Halovulum dunhuangense]
MTADTGYFIRPGRPDDVPGVDSLLARSYPRLLKADYAPSALVMAIPLIARAQPALVACGTYYVAELADGTIIGAGGWTRHNPATGRAEDSLASIRHFATDPDLVRRGIGRALMNRCLREARAAGMTGMLCYSTRTAVPFYASQGFVPLADVEIELQPGIRFPAVRMERVVP